MIITGGENVYPNEVEEVLIQHPAVQASAVVGRPDPRWGQAVVALVELVPGGQASAESIIAFARERLAGFKCPKRVDFIPSLPRTASGKIRRQEARRLMLEQPDA
jgi:fatty-acyl-CoA synthase